MEVREDDSNLPLWWLTWLRNFLLFIPTANPNLRKIFSYYSATGTLNPEGDVHINDSLQGLGEEQQIPSRISLGEFPPLFILVSPLKSPTAPDAYLISAAACLDSHY